MKERVVPMAGQGRMEGKPYTSREQYSRVSQMGAATSVDPYLSHGEVNCGRAKSLGAKLARGRAQRERVVNPQRPGMVMT